MKWKVIVISEDYDYQILNTFDNFTDAEDYVFEKVNEVTKKAIIDGEVTIRRKKPTCIICEFKGAFVALGKLVYIISEEKN